MVVQLASAVVQGEGDGMFTWTLSRSWSVEPAASSVCASSASSFPLYSKRVHAGSNFSSRLCTIFFRSPTLDASVRSDSSYRCPDIDFTTTLAAAIVWFAAQK